MKTQSLEKIYSKHGLYTLALAQDAATSVIEIFEEDNSCQDMVFEEIMKVISRYRRKRDEQNSPN